MDKKDLLERLDGLTEKALTDEVVARATIAEACARTIRAVDTMSIWLVQAQTGFNQNDYTGIQKILDGVTPTQASK